MPRDGTQTYILPFPDVVADTTIESPVYNGFTNDVAQDLNNPRPISSGGTGATSAAGALAALGGEAASQVVTNYDSFIFMAGSFYSAAGATGAPNAHAFSGIIYITDSNNGVVEARDSSDGKLYIRRKVSGVWGAWTADDAGLTAGLAAKVSIAGDTMTGMLVLPATVPTLGTHATNKTYVDTADAALAANNTSQDTAIGNRVRYDASQVLTADQQSQARANIDITQKNYVVNGAMQLSQENGTTSGTTDSYYPVDQFLTAKAGTTGTFTIAQVASTTPGGSPNRLRVNVTLADAAVAAADEFSLIQRIEGLRTTDLLQGTASAKTVTVSFGVKAPAGTYCVAIRNSAANRSYVGEYVIAGGEANTDVRKSVVIPLDQSGTWLDTNGIGMIVSWTLMGGSTFQTTANAWQASNFFSTSSQFNFMGTGGNVFELFDVSLTKGNVAPPFTVPEYINELALCQRYWSLQVAAMRVTSPVGATAWLQCYSIPQMRIAPVMTIVATGSSTNITAFTVAGSNLGTMTNITFSLSTTGSGDAVTQNRTYSANSRL